MISSMHSPSVALTSTISVRTRRFSCGIDDFTIGFEEGTEGFGFYSVKGCDLAAPLTAGRQVVKDC